MTNNTIKDQIIALFVDNVDNNISAADMRTYIDAIFDTKEEQIVKIPQSSELPINTNIYEGSLVVIYNEGTKNGLYLSTINQPQILADLIKI